jgi:molecular chaperone GrpE
MPTQEKNGADVPEQGDHGKEKAGEEPASSAGNLQKEYDELNDRFLRLAADFENYRRRMSRDLDQQVLSAIERFAVELIEVADNFERALKAEDVSSREGLEQIRKLFRTILERHGIREMESVGKTFNPAEHEAIACESSDGEDGIVLTDVCQGYTMNDRVIRCAKVVVSKRPESE